MEKFYRFFPISAAVRPDDLGSVVLSIVIYVAACAVFGVLQAVFGWIPFVGGLIAAVFSLLGLYCVAGIVLSLLKYFRQ